MRTRSYRIPDDTQPRCSMCHVIKPVEAYKVKKLSDSGPLFGTKPASHAGSKISVAEIEQNKTLRKSLTLRIFWLMRIQRIKHL
jgi:hypothetical protein